MNKKASNGDGPKPEGYGESYFSQVWNLYSGIWKDQLDSQVRRSSRILHKVRSGQFRLDEWFEETGQMWSDWMSGMERAWGSASTAPNSVPTIGFAVDTLSQAADPKCVPVAAALGQGVRPETTPLRSLGNNAEYAGKIDAVINDNGLCVSLVNLRVKPELPCGHYAAAIYAAHTSSRVMLALVHVVVA